MSNENNVKTIITVYPMVPLKEIFLKGLNGPLNKNILMGFLD